MKNTKIIIAFSVLSATAAFADMTISVNPEKTYQTIDNFAASDAWSGNFVGQYFGAEEKAQVAKWLFSAEIGRDGNPQGIGLSMWRVNVGGGSLEQDGADIEVFQRRAESFLTKDGKNFDWGKCAGQQYFMREAKKYGCNKFLLFSNTPPVQMTRNGKGYAAPDMKANLKPDCYGKFADFLADVAKHFQDEGYNIAYISPVNEPQADWTKNSKQEGSPWRTSEIYKVIVELDKSLENRGLDNTKLIIGEPANMSFVHIEKKLINKPKWKKVPEDERPFAFAMEYADPNSKNYLLGLKHTAKFIGCHSYGYHGTNKILVDTRKDMKAVLAKYGIGFQQTEWCMLPNVGKKNQWGLTPDWYAPNHADMQAALLMGRIICADISIADATGWSYWKGMEVNGNYALISVFPYDGNLMHGGAVRSNKLLWTLGNFSLFVRPNFRRIEILGADDYDKIVSAAFASPDGKRVVAVFVNSSFDFERVKIALPKKFAVKGVQAFRTDENSDLSNMRTDNIDSFPISPRSVTTLVLDLQ